ncbi:hypothetical protein AB1N83_003632 [Pleurotus pulmonarius]
MGFFNKASNFTVNGTTMNDNKSTVQGSYNNHSQRVVAGGNTTNNNNGGGSFYQANGVQNVHVSTPASQARQGRARQTGAARSPRLATGAANLAARAGGRPRHAIDQRHHKPTRSLSQPPIREALSDHAAATHSRKDIFDRDPRDYSQPDNQRSLIPTQSTTDFGNGWNGEPTGTSAGEYGDVDDQGDVETFGKRPFDNERLHSCNPVVPGSRRRRRN